MRHALRDTVLLCALIAAIAATGCNRRPPQTACELVSSLASMTPEEAGRELLAIRQRTGRPVVLSGSDAWTCGCGPARQFGGASEDRNYGGDQEARQYG